VWLSRAIKVGEMITVRTGLDLYEGIFETIDDSGNLVLKMDCGAKVIPAGDVYF
jgi:BirA family biotin operon repressor/biotin-[acetyl-CoA-carboxylase] ligase